MTSSLTVLQIKINRLAAQKAALETKIKRHQQSAQKAQTQTLLHVGSLVHLAGLLDDWAMEEEKDLTDNDDKAALLLGLLLTLKEQMPPTLSVSQQEKLRQKGRQLLKPLKNSGKKTLTF